MNVSFRKRLSYVIGVALGDGNLSNPNGRAIRLRITCDAKYPRLGTEIVRALQELFPTNKVSIIPKKKTAFDISVYSNKLAEWMPWVTGRGPKATQNAHVPEWIRTDSRFAKECLRGLIQTDGCIYRDRGYLMVNFTNNTLVLAEDVRDMLYSIGFIPSFLTTNNGKRRKYTVRVARNANKLIHDLNLYKE